MTVFVLPSFTIDSRCSGIARPIGTSSADGTNVVDMQVLPLVAHKGPKAALRADEGSYKLFS